MDQPLRVLIIEDSEDDTLLLVRKLQQGGYEPSFERVDSAQTMAAVLAAKPWDIILADYSMPYFSGAAALQLLKETELDIPFIFVSGTIGEDTAVAGMKAGAQDYLMKDNLRRLIPAIERELREAEVRRKRRHAEEKVELHRRRQAVSYDINLAMTSTLDLKKVLDLLLEKNDLLLPYSATTVSLINKADGKLEPVAYHNVDEEKWKAQELEHGLTNVVFEIKSPLVVGNLQTHPGLQDRDFYLDQGFVSYLGVPLIIRGEVLGVLSFYTKGEHLFADEEIEFLSTLAGQAAIAIDNAQLYKEMTELAANLGRSNKVKDEFLSVMSHELRTPLNVVVGYAGMMKDGMLGEVNPQQEEALGKMIGHANEQLALVNNILCATVLEAEKINVETHEFVLGDFFNQFKSAYDLPTRKEPIIRWECAEPLAPIRTDAAKLKLILNNLVDNALKFTKSGQVKISAQIVEEDNRQQAIEKSTDASRPPPRAYVEFKVADTGVGIPQDHLSLIFERFHQVDSSETRLFGGVGMGLYIVKQFTALLGGTIGVESEPDKGTTFTVRIPLQK